MKEAIEEDERRFKHSQLGKQVEHSYRWDVRGNYAHRIIEGTGPLDPKVEKKLRQRKFKIVLDSSQLTADELAVLLRKGFRPPRLGSWLALRRWWRRDHEKGPVDAPKVPSTRRVAAQRVASANDSPIA
jgi:hypothetical protein